MDDLDDLLNSIRNEEDDDEIPEGLDDLLESIVNEVKEVKKEVGKPQSSSALAVIPKAEKKGEDVVDEDIDPLILRLLGLDGTYDIDYDTYKTLLREKMAAGRMPDSKMPSEEIEILTNEFKRVKGKTGRFKVKAQAIRAESFVAKKKQSATTKTANTSSDITGGKKVPLIKPSDDTGDDVSEAIKLLAAKISDVNDNVRDIVDTEKKKKKIEDKKTEKDRIASDKTRKLIREERYERGSMATGLTNALSSAIAPVKGVLDVIGDFLKRFLIGTAIMELLKFLENPQEYVNGIARWMNGVIDKIEDGIKDFIKKQILPKINETIGGVNNQIKGIVGQLNDIIDKIPGNSIKKIDSQSVLIPTIPNSSIDNSISLPRIPMIGNALPTAIPSPIQQGQPQSGAPAGGSGGAVGGNYSGGGGDWSPLLAQIRKAEGGYESISGRKPIAGLTNWTIQKVANDAPSYAGAYQLDPREVVRWAADVGLKPTDKFTPKNQDKIAVGLIEGRAQGKKWRSKKISDEKFGNNLATIWAGLPVLSSINGKQRGSSYYAGVSWNKANVTPEAVEGAFRKIGSPSASSTAPSPAVSSPATTQAQVVTPSPNVQPPAAPGSAGLSNLPIPVPVGGQQNNQTSVASAGQKVPPTFSAYDKTNPSWLVIKSIYNIVG